MSVLAGALVVCVPQLWFVLRATRSGLPTAAAGLALAKFGLVSTGFALWFVWRPEAELLATLSGSAVTLVATTGAIAFVQRQL